MIAAGGANGYLAVALGVGLTGLISLIAWLVLQISDLKEGRAENRGELEGHAERLARIESMIFRPAWTPKNEDT